VAAAGLALLLTRCMLCSPLAGAQLKSAKREFVGKMQSIRAYHPGDRDRLNICMLSRILNGRLNQIELMGVQIIACNREELQASLYLNRGQIFLAE
jgi:hypothetical protein